MKVTWSSAASRDFHDAVTYLMARNPDATAQLVAGVEHAIELLADGRFSGPEVMLPTGDIAHAWSVYPYRLYYDRRGDDELRILRLFHQRRQPIER